MKILLYINCSQTGQRIRERINEFIRSLFVDRFSHSQNFDPHLAVAVVAEMSIIVIEKLHVDL